MGRLHSLPAGASEAQKGPMRRFSAAAPSRQREPTAQVRLPKRQPAVRFYAGSPVSRLSPPQGRRDWRESPVPHCPSEAWTDLYGTMILESAATPVAES